jgi:hypothetical protein
MSNEGNNSLILAGMLNDLGNDEVDNNSNDSLLNSHRRSRS